MQSRHSCPEILSLAKLWDRSPVNWGTTNKMYGGFYVKKDWGTPKLRQTNPWYTTNSEYGHQVEKIKENIHRRLTGQKENKENRPRDKIARSSLSSASSSSSSLSSLSNCDHTDALAPANKKDKSNRGLYTREKERYRGGMPILAPQASSRLPPLQIPASLPPYTYTMSPNSDKRVVTLEKSYYQRPVPQSGLGKRFMLGECPRLWSNMGKLERIPTPTQPEVLSLEPTAEETAGQVTENEADMKDCNGAST